MRTFFDRGHDPKTCIARRCAEVLAVCWLSVGCSATNDAVSNASTGGKVEPTSGANAGGATVTEEASGGAKTGGAGAASSSTGWTGGTSNSGGSGSSGGAAGSTDTLVCPELPSATTAVPNGSSPLVDLRDGQTYPTIQVGSQTWMARNLNLGQMVPGIREFPGLSDDTKIEKFCHGDILENCTRCGGLYTWAETMALAATCTTEDCSAQVKAVHQGICPTGWHVPKQNEWTTLAASLATQTGFLTIDQVDYECRPDLGTAMKSTSGWLEGGNGTNVTGFNGVAAGWRHGWGQFYHAGRIALFLSADREAPTGPTTARSLHIDTTRFCISPFLPDHSVSVRCVKD